MTDRPSLNALGKLHRRFWYVGDIIVIGLLFAYVTYVHSYSWISYRGGLRNTGAPAFAAGIFMGMMLPLAGILLLILIFRLGVSWPKCIRDRRRLWKLRGLVIAALGLYGGLFFVRIWPSPDAFTLGLREYYGLNVDIPAIQTWLRTVDPEDCWGEQLTIRIDALPEAEQARWPEAIKAMKPACLVRLYLDADRRPVVRLEWGGFDEAWGIVIGSIDWEIPRTRLRREEMTEQSAFYERADYVRPLAPGAYVWYDF